MNAFNGCHANPETRNVIGGGQTRCDGAVEHYDMTRQAEPEYGLEGLKTQTYLCGRHVHERRLDGAMLVRRGHEREDEYRSVCLRYERLRHIGQQRTAAEQGEFERQQARLREILAVPPDGYSLPAVGQRLIDDARTAGWTARAFWTSPGYEGEPSVTVVVGRVITEGEQRCGGGDHWRYSITWHSRDCAPGKVRLFGRVLAKTPWRPGDHEVGSVKAVREVIAAHPAPAVEGAK